MVEINDYPSYTITVDGVITRKYDGYVLKHSVQKKSGYSFVNLVNEFGKTPVYIKNLIAEHFLPNDDPLRKVVVGIIDTTIIPNHKLDNLEWRTKKEHAQKASIKPENTTGVMICKICNTEQTLINFDKCGKHYKKTCHTCRNLKEKEKRDNNQEYKEKIYDSRRRNFMKRKYGMTPENKVEMLEIQENKCGICKEEFKDQTLAHIDHCHKTGNIRELLCPNCNRLLGMAHDNILVLENAILYLKKHSHGI